MSPVREHTSKKGRRVSEKKETDLMGRLCEAGKGLSPPAAAQVVFPVLFSASLSGSHPISWGMPLKGGITGGSLPAQQENVVFLHLSYIFLLLLLPQLWACRSQPRRAARALPMPLLCSEQGNNCGVSAVATSLMRSILTPYLESCSVLCTVHRLS